VFGLFSVMAAYQSKGIGKKLLIDAIMRSKALNYTLSDPALSKSRIQTLYIQSNNRNSLNDNPPKASQISVFGRGAKESLELIHYWLLYICV
jgi:GNAT superfamily N-acetyltransferase